LTTSHPSRTSKLAPLAAVSAVAVVALAVGLWASCSDQGRSRYPTAREGPTEAAVPPIPQARWRVTTFPAGKLAGLTPKDRRRIREQKPRLAGLVRSVYDVLFLRPQDERDALRARFARSAARSFASLRRVGAPPTVARVKTLLREARIGIQAPGARRAVALVNVRARGLAGQREWRVSHTSTLWLERARGGWRVIAFDVDQHPLAA
jgi:hypothetical protein